MEPFISTAYDGPQFDDVLASQRQYGDPHEPNDTPATATVLNAPTSLVTTFRMASCDDRLDPDYYRLTLPGAGILSLTVRPIGGAYLQGTQTQQCNTGSTFDALTVNDLNIQLVAANQTTMGLPIQMAAAQSPARGPSCARAQQATASAMTAAEKN